MKGLHTRKRLRVDREKMGLKADLHIGLDEDYCPVVQDILGKPPRWIVRWGMVSISAIVMLLILGSAFLKYPEIERCPIVVTTENMPVHLAARATGKIDTLLVEDRALVMAGDVLAVLENTANYTDVQQMKMYMAAVYAAYLGSFSDTVIDGSFLNDLSLGELQGDFYRFVKAVNECLYFVEKDYFEQKIAVLKNRRNIEVEIRKNISKQMIIAKEQLEIQEHLYNIDSSLFEGNALSGVAYGQSRTVMLQARQTYENAVASVNTAALTVTQTEQEIWELYQAQQDRKQELYTVLSGAYGDLMARLKAWEQAYVFQTPITGFVALTNYWQKNQQVVSGEILLSVVPVDSCRMTGKIMLPSYGAGKVCSGQRVNIKFNGFPYMEYGVVRAKVGRISIVPVQQEKEMYRVVEVLMPDSLVTNYGKTLVFSQQMQGEAEIITEDLSVLERILNPIKSALKR